MRIRGRIYSSAICVGLVMMLSLATFGQNNFSGTNNAVASEFEKRAKDYSQLRERLERELPKLPKQASPEQIETHKAKLLKSVQTARAGARQGDIFTPDAIALIRGVIKTQFQGRDRAELRKSVFEAETQGVPIKVNAAYPESKELIEMPPSLLLALPQLPKQLRYRFVGTSMLLVDRENNLIVDYMTNALP